MASESQVPVTEASMEEDDDRLTQGGDDEVRKIDVSGGNISLVVDFSGSLGGTISDNVFESNGSCPNGNENQTLECLVGNLVWTMNKSKKWWAGEVVGFKADAKESCMVRYISQSQLVSWCAPCKLKPFKESFEKMVNQREDMGFFVAVEKAMTLLGNSLKLEMACSCISERNGVMPARKAKPLILREFSIDLLEPREFVTQLKNLAKCVSSAGILELTVMQSRLSAFSSFCGHKQIPMDQLHLNEVRTSFSAAKMKDSQFVGSPSVVAGSSRRRFQNEWFRKFVSEVDNASLRDHIANTSPSDLVSKLKLLAVDFKCSEESENMGLFEWFFSKFRISVFHDENVYKMQLANMTGLIDLMVCKDANPQKTSKSKKLMIEPISGVSLADTEQKTFESEESNMETLNAVSTPDNEHKSSKPKKPALKKTKHTIGHSDLSTYVTNEPFAKESSVQSLHGEACSLADTYVPDLNNGGNPLALAEFDHVQKPETLISPQIEEMPRTMMFNFQVAERHFSNVTSLKKKKRGRKHKSLHMPYLT